MSECRSHCAPLKKTWSLCWSKCYSSLIILRKTLMWDGKAKKWIEDADGKARKWIEDASGVRYTKMYDTPTSTAKHMWFLLNITIACTKSLQWTRRRLKYSALDTDPHRSLYSSWVKQTNTQLVIFTQKMGKTTIRGCSKFCTSNSCSNSLWWTQETKIKGINGMSPVRRQNFALHPPAY